MRHFCILIPHLLSNYLLCFKNMYTLLIYAQWTSVLLYWLICLLDPESYRKQLDLKNGTLWEWEINKLRIIAIVWSKDFHHFALIESTASSFAPNPKLVLCLWFSILIPCLSSKSLLTSSPCPGMPCLLHFLIWLNPPQML